MKDKFVLEERFYLQMVNKVNAYYFFTILLKDTLHSRTLLIICDEIPTKRWKYLIIDSPIKGSRRWYFQYRELSDLFYVTYDRIIFKLLILNTGNPCFVSKCGYLTQMLLAYSSTLSNILLSFIRQQHIYTILLSFFLSIIITHLYSMRFLSFCMIIHTRQSLSFYCWHWPYIILYRFVFNIILNIKT